MSSFIIKSFFSLLLSITISSDKQSKLYWETVQRSILSFFPLLVGVSHFCQYVVDIAAVQAWFDKRRGLAVGLLMSAASIGEQNPGPMFAPMCILCKIFFT